MAMRSRRGLGWWWRGWAVAAAVFMTSMTPRVGVASEDRFPEPPELAAAVRFWAATFTQYGQRDVVIHDRVVPGLVYEVVHDVSSTDDPRVQAGIQAAVERLERAASHVPAAFALLQGRPRRWPRLPAFERIAECARPSRRGSPPSGLFRATVRGPSTPSTCPSSWPPCPWSSRSITRARLIGGSGGPLAAVERSRGPFRAGRRQGRRATRSRPRERGGRRVSARAARAIRQLAARHYGLQSWADRRAACSRASGIRRPGADRSPVRRPGFGFASRNFYAEFLAARHVLRHASDYFLEIRPGRLVAYKVRRGDTLERVAKRHGVSIPSLRASNGIRAALIRPGQMSLVRL